MLAAPMGAAFGACGCDRVELEGAAKTGSPTVALRPGGGLSKVGEDGILRVLDDSGEHSKSRQEAAGTRQRTAVQDSADAVVARAKASEDTPTRSSKAIAEPDEEPRFLEQDDLQFVSMRTLYNAVKGGDTALVRAEWYVEQHRAGGRLQRRQEVEEQSPTAFVKDLRPDNVWRFALRDGKWINVDESGKYLIVAISYPWLTPEHPDPMGTQLGILACFLEKMSGELRPYGKSVAVFLDYMSLYQRARSPGERDWTSQQAAAFQRALNVVGTWYAHPATQVWLLPHTAEDRPYHARGWTTFEWRVAQLASRVGVDLSRLDAGEPLFFALGGTYATVRGLRTARLKASAPLPPARFDVEVESKTFSAGAEDLAIVKRAYKTLFDQVVAGATALDYSDSAWSEDDISVLVRETLPLCGQLRVLKLSRLPFSDASARAVGEACAGLQELWLNECAGVADGAIELFAQRLSDLQVLTLKGCSGVTDASLFALLKGCPRLRLLDVTNCPRVTHAFFAELAQLAAQRSSGLEVRGGAPGAAGLETARRVEAARHAQGSSSSCCALS